jgi:FAD:protein FMN transferase
MGVETRIVLYAPDEAAAVRAAARAFDRIARLDSILSDYRADSELSGLVARAGGPAVPVSPELFHVLARAQRFACLADGAFDVTAGPLVRLWRAARRSGVLPTAAEREAAAARVGWRHLELDPVARTVRLRLQGMQLDLGGIGKGYAAGEALATLRAAGIDRAMVAMGGDIAASGPPPGERGWRIRIAHMPPDGDTLLLAHAAVSSSGDTEQYVEIDGVR